MYNQRMQKQHFRTDDDVDKYAKPYGPESSNSDSRGAKKPKRERRGNDEDEELRQAIELSK